MAETAQVGQQVGISKRVVTVAARGRAAYGALPAERRRWLAVGLTMVLAMGAAMLWYAGRTDWRVVFTGLEGRDLQEVESDLAAGGISYQTTADGTGVEVPAELLDKARMAVAAKGMPASGRMGFELFDKPNWVGSEFDEKVNYQRAMEGELEHTIETLGVVRSARVHLVLPEQSLFAGEQKLAKASVVLKLKRSTLTAEQTEGIRNLVAGAVENLTPDQVTLVDADGRANLQPHAAGDVGDAEQAMEASLVKMLEPLAGPGNVRATVNVSYEEGSEERTDEIYDPSQSAPLTLQKSSQTVAAGAAGRASGVPGTASNTPAAAPEGAVQGSAAAAAPGTPPLLQGGKAPLPVWPQGQGGGQNTAQESGTYAVSKHTIHTEDGPGRVRRVSAAVVVNDRQVMEGAGKTGRLVWKPRTAEEMQRLEQLAQAAVGFDAKRGDQVVMENVSFSSNGPETQAAGVDKVMEQAKGLLSQQPGLLRTGVIAALGLLLVIFVLRPVAGQVVATLKEPLLLTTGGTTAQVGRMSLQGLSDGSAADGRDEAATASEPARLEPGKGLPVMSRNAVYEQVAEHIRREPSQSTRLLQAWIGDAGEAQ